MAEQLVSDFFHARFPDLAPHFIEVRLIEDRKRGRVVEQRWYDSVERLLADLARLREVTEKHSAAVFYGVLPRTTRGKGSTEFVAAGRAAWVDLDFKDFAGGEAEARKRLTAFSVPPSIVVSSGHGLHVYWLLRENYAPAELSEISRRIAAVLGGDHTFDAARILRAPGTFNRKDPANPIAVDIERFEPTREYCLSELADAPEFGGFDFESNGAETGAGAGKATEADTEFEIPNEPSKRVLELIRTLPRLRNLWLGVGKPGKGEDGKPLDISGSGYDWSFTSALIREGIEEPSELAGALRSRLDGHAREKGPRYVRLTVQKALAVAQSSARPSAAAPRVDFVVEHARRYDSDPPRFEFVINGKTMQLASVELKNKSRFEQRFLDVHNRLPSLPRKAAMYRSLVNDWLAHAEIIPMPPEASDALALREDIERIIAGLPCGNAADDLERGKACNADDGRRVFKVAAIRRALQDDYPSIPANVVCAALKALKYESITPTVDGKKVRGWAR